MKTYEKVIYPIPAGVIENQDTLGWGAIWNLIPGNNIAENPRKFLGIFLRNPRKFPGIFLRKIR